MRWLQSLRHQQVRVRKMQKDEIGLYKNIGVTKIKGKLGFPKTKHNKEQIKKALKSQGVDIKFLDEE